MFLYSLLSVTLSESTLLLVVVLSLARIALSQNDNCTYHSFPGDDLVISPLYFHKKFILPKDLNVTNYIWSYNVTYYYSSSTINSVGVPKNLNGLNVLIIQSFKLYKGDTELTIAGQKRESSLPGPSLFQKTCKIYVQFSKPVVLITGGSERVVSENREIVVNGSKSYDPNKVKLTLHFFWSCEQKIKPYSFCPKNPEESITEDKQFKIPADNVKTGDEFYITLTVSTENKTNSFTQRILVVPKAADLEIECTKNCNEERKSPYLSTEFEVKCEFNCEGITEEDYLWTMGYENSKNKLNFDYNNGRTGKKFIIDKNILEADVNYKVTVELKSRMNLVGKASLTFNFYPKPNITNCRLEQFRKEKGKYVVKCDDSGENDLPTSYKVFARDPNDPEKDEDITNGFFELRWANAFKLPSQADSKEIFIRISRKSRTVVEMLLEKYKNTTRPDFYIISINNFIKEIPECVKSSTSENLLEAPPNSVDEAMRTIRLMKELASNNSGTHCGISFFKDVICACKKIMETSLHLAKSKNSSFLHENKKQILSTMTKCLTIEPNKNTNLFAPIQLNVTTLKPSVDYPVLTEYYPNYEDPNENYYKNIDIMQHVTFDIINGTSVTAKLMALSANGTDFTKTIGKEGTVGAIKGFGDNLRKNTIHSDNVTVISSEDFIDDNHLYDILVATWNKDIFWWNPRKVQVVTDIINFEVWHASCKKRETNFTKPFHIFFDTKSDIVKSRKIIKDVLVVPKNYASLSNDEMNYRIRAHFLFLPKEIEVLIHFHNLSDPLEVVLTQNKFPSMDDFTRSINVTKDYKTLTIKNDHDQDVFLYVGIIVNRKSVVEKQFVKYTVSFTVRTCIRWIMNKNQWIPSCQLGRGSNNTVIHCECTHLSVIAGYEQPIPSAIKEVRKYDIELELQSCLIIFLTVVVSFGVFFLLFLCVAFEKKNEVYFLSDNNSKDRFAYLLLVRTGNGLRSGTTSNIVVKIIGSNESSEPHVLNYPDPQLKILQQCGKDMFLMTTDNYLGNLERIEIWFDCIGTNPYWYCQKITVYDLQKRKKWNFIIKRQLSVPKKVTFIVADAMEEELKKTDNGNNKFGFILKPPLKYHTWLLCQYEYYFSHLKKLTVILSTILSLYTLVLMFYCLPTFQLLDGLDERRYHFDYISVLIGFGASLIAFLTHVFVVWYFRSSSIQFSRYDDVVQLPFVFTKLCWIFLTILIVFTTTFLITVGFWVPPKRSWMWLSTCGVGVAFIILVYENIFLVIQSFYSKLAPFDIWKHHKNLVKEIVKQRIYLSEQFGEHILRPYFQHLYHPLMKKDIKAKFRSISKRKKGLSEFQNLIMFFIYIIILYIVVLANKDSMVVRGNMNMMEILEGLHTRTISFTNLTNIHDIYNYLNETFIPALHPSRWYGNYVISDPALMIDVTNKFIGVARIRQHRLKQNVCKVAELMRFLNTNCVLEFKHAFAESGTFGYKWGNFSMFWYYDRLRGMWEYSEMEKTETLFTWGEFSIYSGGGYIAFLGRTLYNSYANFHNILRNLWIDDKTRAIFIEFLTYSADYNIFNAIRLTFEQSAVGFLYKRVDVHTVRMLFVHNEFEAFTVTFFFLFVIWVGMLFIKHSLETIKHIRSVYKDPWVIIDSVIILLSVICIVLFIIRTTLIGNYLKFMEQAKHNEFASYFHMFYIENFLTFVAAFLVAIATLRLWIFFRFITIFRLMEKTLAIAIGTLLAFSIVLAVLILGFGMCMVLLLGNDFENLRSLSTTMRLLMATAFNVAEFKVQKFLTHRLGLLYICLYEITILVSIFFVIVIIFNAYLEAQLEFSSEGDSYTLKDYVQERLCYFPKFLKYKCIRVKAGGTTKVIRKPVKFLYFKSRSVTTSRMMFMRYLTQAVLRNKKQFTKTAVLSEGDCQLMLNVCKIFFFDDEEDVDKEVFYKGRVQNKGVRFVYERQVEKIANIANLLLQEEISFTDFREKRDPQLEECLQKIKRNQKTLKQCCKRLKLVLHQINSMEHIMLQKLI